MRHNVLYTFALAAVSAVAAACAAPDAVAPSSAAPRLSASTEIDGISTVSRTVDRYVWLSCTNGGAGEAIHVTGEIRYDMQRTKDSSGVYHLNIKSNTSNLTGVGLTTGALYRGLMTERVNARAEGYMDQDLWTADIIRFVSPTSGESYSLMATTHIVVQDGSYVVFDQEWSEVCR